MVEQLTSLPIFGISLTLIAYVFALYIAKRFSSPLTNPIIVASLLCIVVLKMLHIPIEQYQIGGELLVLLILPATISLSVKVYENREHLRNQVLPVIVGSTVGAAVSIISVQVLGKLFGLDGKLISSLLPKSVTAAIAMDLSPLVDGVVSISIMAVMITGITGVLIGPLLLRLLRVSNPTLEGIAMGTASHVIGTARALEMGPQQGAISSIALFSTGIATVGMLLFFL